MDENIKTQVEEIVDLKLSAAAKAEQDRQQRATDEAQATARREAEIKNLVDAQLSAKMREINEAAIKAGRPQIFGDNKPADLGDDAIKAFNDYLRTGAVKATMNEGTAGQGGYLVPTKYSNELVKSLSEVSLLRAAGARVISVAGTNSFKVPALTHTGRAVKTAESAAYDQAEPTLSEIAFTPIKYTRLSKVTEELLSDSRFDVFSQILVPDAVQAFAKAENDDFTVGDGSGDPQGVVTGASAGVTAAGASAITADEIIDLYHSLGYLYRANAVWMMNDSTLKAVRKLKDSTNQYLWQPGLAAGQPDRLLGRPVYTNNNMAELGATNVTVLFGDMSYYWIADFGGLEVKRLNELYAANGHVGFNWYKRYDARVVLSAAIKKLTQAA